MFREEHVAMMTRWRFWLVLCPVILGCLLADPAQGAKRQLTPENYVRQQAAKGEWADLNLLGKKDADCILSARFLEDLLTGDYKVLRKGVRIKNAIIDESLDLERARIPHAVELVNCWFQGKVVCRDAVFEKTLITSGCHFYQLADFNGMRVHLDAEFEAAVFHGPVDFCGAGIERQLSAKRAEFRNEKEPANFNNLKVGWDAFFDQAIFQGPVDFANADIGMQFRATEVQFCNENEEVNFNSLKVGRSALIHGALFNGPVDFKNIKVKEFFEIIPLRGNNKAQPTVFKSLVDFEGADIGGVFDAGEAQFQGTTIFGYMKVGQGANFYKAIFTGPVSFGGADIRGQFLAKEAQFQSTGHRANFNGMRVGQNANFDDATFKGPVDFVGADIRGQFSAEGVKFESTEHPATFNGLQVGQTVFLRNVTFHSDVNLMYCSFLDLYFQGAVGKQQEKTGSQATLFLTGAQIQRELIVTDLELKSLEAGRLRVKGAATFAWLHIKEKTDFQNAAMENLEFNDVTGPEEPEKNLKLDGLTYTSLCVDGPDSFGRALGLVARSAFNPQNYGQLEDYCKRRGHPEWADEVSIAMKDRELDQRAWYVRWLKKIFWGWPAGYGRKPMRLLVASLIIIFVGAALFNPVYLERDKNPLKSLLPSDPEYAVEEKKPTQGGKLRVVLLRFLISLDQFLPAVNLGLADNWKAKDTHFLVWLFFTVEQGFGWIFVSIGLAAIYTQIK